MPADSTNGNRTTGYIYDPIGNLAHFCSMCGPHFCSMKITQDVRDYAAKQGLDEQAALKQGMEEKAVEFVKKGAELYSKA